MQLPAQYRILREDLQDAPSWVSGIINPVNSFMAAVYQTLNKNVTFPDNFAAFVQQVQFTTTSSYPTITAFTFKNSLNVSATGCLLVSCYISNTYVPGCVTGIAWIENNGVITISSVLGLLASTSYNLTFLVF